MSRQIIYYKIEFNRQHVNEFEYEYEYKVHYVH